MADDKLKDDQVEFTEEDRRILAEAKAALNLPSARNYGRVYQVPAGIDYGDTVDMMRDQRHEVAKLILVGYSMKQVSNFTGVSMDNLNQYQTAFSQEFDQFLDDNPAAADAWERELTQRRKAKKEQEKLEETGGADSDERAPIGISQAAPAPQPTGQPLPQVAFVPPNNRVGREAGNADLPAEVQDSASHQAEVEDPAETAERGKVARMRKDGMTQQEVADKLNIPVSRVQKHDKKIREQGGEA